MAFGMSSIPPPPRGQSEPPEAGRSSDPRARTETSGRPRFLTFALVLALFFGAGGWTDGCNRLAFFRGERQHLTDLVSQIPSSEDRAHSQALYDSWIETADNARGRGVPLAAGTFVLGAALLLLAARGLAGRGNARSALMQVVTAQAILVAVSYFVLRDVWKAEDTWQYYTGLVLKREEAPPDAFPQVVKLIHFVQRWEPPAWLAFRSFASLLILVALSRPRARTFFETPSDPLSDSEP